MKTSFMKSNSFPISWRDRGVVVIEGNLNQFPVSSFTQVNLVSARVQRYIDFKFPVFIRKSKQSVKYQIQDYVIKFEFNTHFLSHLLVHTTQPYVSLNFKHFQRYNKGKVIDI